MPCNNENQRQIDLAEILDIKPKRPARHINLQEEAGLVRRNKDIKTNAALSMPAHFYP